MIDTCVSCTLNIQYYSHTHQYLTVVGSGRADTKYWNEATICIIKIEHVCMAVNCSHINGEGTCRPASCMQYVDF